MEGRETAEERRKTTPVTLVPPAIPAIVGTTPVPLSPAQRPLPSRPTSCRVHSYLSSAPPATPFLLFFYIFGSARRRRRQMFGSEESENVILELASAAQEGADSFLPEDSFDKYKRKENVAPEDDDGLGM